MFTQTPLSQFDGYIILLSFGTIFTIGMIGITYCLQRYHGENRMSTETFLMANRKVKSGLIVSSMTWAATLLQSSSVTYSYGIFGSFWYASASAVTSILFSIVAIEFKRLLLPLGTIIYTYFGGIKATFLIDYFIFLDNGYYSKAIAASSDLVIFSAV